MLADDEWIGLYAEYNFTEKRRFDNLSLALKMVLCEVLAAAFGGQQNG